MPACRAPGPLWCKPSDIGTERQEIWVPRGGTGSSSNTGRTGKKARPAAMWHHTLAENARTYAARKGKSKPGQPMQAR